MKLDHNASGIYPIAPTPFFKDGSIDWLSVDRMTDFYVSIGCQGMTVLGVLGEAPKLDADEAVALARRVIERAGSMSVIVGVSSPGFAAMKALAQKVMTLGAAGVMIAPSNAAKTEDQIAAYFRNAVAAIGDDIPWVLQDYPLSTGVVMAPGLIRRVANENKSLAVLKHEDWPGLDKITALRGFEKDSTMRPISILVGNNGLFFDFELDRGVNGANTGYPFPDMLVEMRRLAGAGKRDEAHDLFDAHLPLLRYEHQSGVGLSVRKYVLMRRGILSSDVQRVPAAPMSDITRTEVDYLLERLAKTDGKFGRMQV